MFPVRESHNRPDESTISPLRGLPRPVRHTGSCGCARFRRRALADAAFCAGQLVRWPPTQVRAPCRSYRAADNPFGPGAPELVLESYVRLEPFGRNNMVRFVDLTRFQSEVYLCKR